MCFMYKVHVKLVSNYFNTYKVNPAVLVNKGPIFSPSQLLPPTTISIYYFQTELKLDLFQLVAR